MAKVVIRSPMDEQTWVQADHLKPGALARGERGAFYIVIKRGGENLFYSLKTGQKAHPLTVAQLLPSGEQLVLENREEDLKVGKYQ